MNRLSESSSKSACSELGTVLLFLSLIRSISDLHRPCDDFFLPVIILGIKLIHVVSVLTARCADDGLIIDVQGNPVPAGQLLGQRF